jgi:hypothetical protein
VTADLARPGRRAAARPARPPWPAPRLIWLHAVSRRIPAALAAIALCAVGLRVALLWSWDSYGALQLPLLFEAAAAAVVGVTAGSPLGDPERATGRWLPFLRLGGALVLTAVAAVALSAAGTGGHLAGGTVDVVRNLAGLAGLSLLCAAILGGGLSWTGPLAYLMAGTYALYSDWHGPAITTPWLWPGRPPHDAGAAICAGLVLAAGLAAVSARGARDPAGE